MKYKILKENDTFHQGYRAIKKQALFMLDEIERARKKYKSFDDKWELEMLKGYIRNL